MSLLDFTLWLLAVTFFGWFAFGLLGHKNQRGPWRRVSTFFGWMLVSLLVLIVVFVAAYWLFPESLESVNEE